MECGFVTGEYERRLTLHCYKPYVNKLTGKQYKLQNHQNYFNWRDLVAGMRSLYRFGYIGFKVEIHSVLNVVVKEV